VASALEVGAGVAVDLETDGDLTNDRGTPHDVILHIVDGFCTVSSGCSGSDRRKIEF